MANKSLGKISASQITSASQIRTTIETDVVIVGAGLVGLSAAVAFAMQGKQVTLVDAKPMMHQKTTNKNTEENIKKTITWDTRIYAISPQTESWLKHLGVWENIDESRVCSINAMDVWHEAEALSLKSSDAHLPKLGVIVENQNLMRALWQKIAALEVTVMAPVNCLALENTAEAVMLSLDSQAQVSAKLLVAADGVNSWLRQQLNMGIKNKDFYQTAIVANFSTQKSHQNIAKQWFGRHETFALLPLVGQNVSLVWSLPTERVNELLELSRGAFTREVEAHAKHMLGDFDLISEVCTFKLNQQTALTTTAERVVLIGDAAHQIHPMAGQGVNLGFRDVMELTSLAAKLHPMQDLGDNAYLRQYARARKADTLAMNTLTSGLDALFASQNQLLKQVANWGLRKLNHHESVKRLLIQQVAS